MITAVSAHAYADSSIYSSLVPSAPLLHPAFSLLLLFYTVVLSLHPVHLFRLGGSSLRSHEKPVNDHGCQIKRCVSEAKANEYVHARSVDVIFIGASTRGVVRLGPLFPCHSSYRAARDLTLDRNPVITST
jgi:hypothetical protein